MKNICPRVSGTGEAFAILLNATALALSASLVAACGAHAQSAHVRAGQAYSVDYKLKNSPDGAYPWAELVPAPDGNLYGTTWAGGTPADCTGGLGSGCGTLFRLDSSGTETVVWNFQGTPGPIHPRGSLLPERDGSFYGFTNEGGSVSVCYKGGAHGCGTFFRFSAHGGLKVLYNFGSQGGYSDAVQPDGAPIACGSGTFCATTYYGGTNENGTLFRITKRGKEQILYRFTGGSDGSHPGAYLVSDSSGNLYDVANGGGGSCNCGTLFRLAPDGPIRCSTHSREAPMAAIPTADSSAIIMEICTASPWPAAISNAAMDSVAASSSNLHRMALTPSSTNSRARGTVYGRQHR